MQSLFSAQKSDASSPSKTPNPGASIRDSNKKKKRDQLSADKAKKALKKNKKKYFNDDEDDENKDDGDNGEAEENIEDLINDVYMKSNKSLVMGNKKNESTLGLLDNKDQSIAESFGVFGDADNELKN
jgi:hypothetical protein